MISAHWIRCSWRGCVNALVVASFVNVIPYVRRGSSYSQCRSWNNNSSKPTDFTRDRVKLTDTQ